MMKKTSKSSLISLHKIQSCDFVDGKNVFTTCGTNVLSKGSDHCMLPSDHEEADTRI